MTKKDRIFLSASIMYAIGLQDKPYEWTKVGELALDQAQWLNNLFEQRFKKSR